jgi:hypothetical protein
MGDEPDQDYILNSCSDDDEDDFQPLSLKETPTHDDIFGDSDDDEDENEAPRKQTHSRLKKGGNKASVSSKKREQSGLEDTDEEDDKPKKKDKDKDSLDSKFKLS